MQNKKITILTGCMIILGISFYIYYGIYKMLFVHIEAVGYDFKLCFDTAQNFLHGCSIYANPNNTPPYLYPPFSILVFLPFRNLTFPEALPMWFMLTHAIVICSVWILYSFGSHVNKKNSAAAAIFSMFLSMPLYFNIFCGNINIIIFLLICLIYKVLFSNKKVIIPWILAFCTYLKIFPFLLIAAFSRRQDIRLIKHFIAAVFIIGIASVAMFGIDEHINFFKTLPKGLDWVGPIHSSSFTFILLLFLPNNFEGTITIINMTFGILLLTGWWFRAQRKVLYGNVSNIIIDLMTMTIMMILLFPSSRVFYNEFFIIPFYFIIFAWLQNGTQFKYFIVFLLIFFSINLWEIIWYHIPLSLDKTTMREIWLNKENFPILYPLTASLPFILNLALFSWLVINYSILVKSLDFLTKGNSSYYYEATE